jgi:hypothetical protein
MPLTATIKIKLRRGTLIEWTTANPVLLHGEVGIVIGEGIGETPEGFVIGNGGDDFNTLWGSSSCVFKPFSFTELEISNLETAIKNWFGTAVSLGSLLAFNSSSNEFEVVPPGTDGQYLIRDDNESTGVKWIDLNAGDMLKSVYDTNDDGRVDAAETLRIEVINKTGSAIAKGKIVYIKSSSSSSNHPEILLADATTEATSSKTIGAVYDTIANDAIGWVVLKGEVHNANTNSFNVGDKLWLATTPGDVTTVKPIPPNHSVFIGHVTRKQSNNGRIVYTIYNGYELNELHDVLFSIAPVQFDILTFDGSLWVNNTIQNVLGYTPADENDVDAITNVNWTGDYDNGVTYSVGDGVMYNGASFRMTNYIGAAGYAPPAYPGNWLQVTDYVSPNDINLGNVDNTSDLDKPISTATQTALNGKQNSLTLTTTGTSGAATLIGNTLNIPEYSGISINRILAHIAAY